ncbi:MAG TPA: GNAT family N-acetyltransferase [Rhodanobacteraceae bacterium]|nr:GNAT family N-acetyltransferase [Rhodanobacteraceae bacterium]
MRAIVAHSIGDFAREEWDRLFPGELEDWSYYRAVEHSRLPGFEWLYFAVRGNGRLLAAVPAFVTDYRLDTTLTGPLRRVTGAIARVFPRLLRQRLLSLGSPIGEFCHLGFAAGVDRAGQARLLDILFSKAEKYARRSGISMLAAKDAAMAQDDLWAAAAAAHRLRRQPSLPTASLDIRFDSLDGYLATLSHATRKDLRRKLKASTAIRVEWRENIDDIIDDVMRLYRATLAHAALTFEELTPEFFTGVLRELAPRSRCATYWLGERLVAFNLVLHDGEVLLDKFLGMDYAFARRYNLYYLTWLTNVAYCVEHGLKRYQSGQGLHREKLRLGSRLSANWLWYRHRNRAFDKVFAAFERLFRLDRHDPELAALLPPPAPPPAPPARGASWLAWTGMIGFAGLSQISLKYAGLDTGAFDFSAHAFALALGSAWLWVSIASHIGEFLVWIAILRKSRLSGAFPTLAVLFVGMILAGRVLFGEPIGWVKAIGCAMILAGILLLGPDDEASPPEAARMP